MVKFRNNETAPINSDYKPPEAIQNDRKQVYLRYSYMQDARGDIEAKWDKWEKQYEAYRPPKNSDDWQSTIVPPFTTTIVERALAEIVDQTIQPMVTPRGPEDVVRAKIVNYIKDYTWEIGDGDLELYNSIKQALILGKTVWQEDYWRDRRQVKILKKFNLDTGTEEYVNKDVDDFDDVYGENVDLRNFFIDPLARTVNRGRYKANDCIRRYIMNLDTFRETFQDSIWDQFGVVSKVRAGGDLNYYQFYQPPKGIDVDNQVEVLMYWGRRPDKLIMIANDVVYRDGPNPFNHKQLPFAEGSDVPRLNQFWARGEPELLESIQDELTTLRRMRIDRQHMDLFKMFLVSNRETLDDDEAIVAPSRFLHVDDPQTSIKALEYRDINPSAYHEEELLKQDGRQVTGVESPAPSGTATEAAIFKESTMKALRLKIWLLSRELLTNVVRLRVPNIIQYYSEPKAVRVIGEKRFAEWRQIRTTDVSLALTKNNQLLEQPKKGDNFFIVQPELITPQYGGYDFKLSGEPTFPVSKPLQQERINQFMQHPVIAAAIQQGYYDVGRMADELSNIHDFDPEKFKKPQLDAEPSMPDESVLLEMANRENQAMLSGKQLPGTPYATRNHTNIHLAFMSSEDFKASFNDQIISVFSRHILEEERAQQARSQAMMQMGPQSNMSPVGKTEAAGMAGGPAAAMMQGKLMGPEMTPPGQMTGNPGGIPEG